MHSEAFHSGVLLLWFISYLLFSRPAWHTHSVANPSYNQCPAKMNIPFLLWDMASETTTNMAAFHGLTNPGFTGQLLQAGVFTSEACSLLCCRFLERKYDTICEFCREHRVILQSTIWALLLTGKLQRAAARLLSLLGVFSKLLSVGRKKSPLPLGPHRLTQRRVGLIKNPGGKALLMRPTRNIILSHLRS